METLLKTLAAILIISFSLGVIGVAIIFISMIRETRDFNKKRENRKNKKP